MDEDFFEEDVDDDEFMKEVDELDLDDFS